MCCAFKNKYQLNEQIFMAFESGPMEFPHLFVSTANKSIIVSLANVFYLVRIFASFYLSKTVTKDWWRVENACLLSNFTNGPLCFKSSMHVHTGERSMLRARVGTTWVLFWTEICRLWRPFEYRELRNQQVVPNAPRCRHVNGWLEVWGSWAGVVLISYRHAVVWAVDIRF